MVRLLAFLCSAGYLIAMLSRNLAENPSENPTQKPITLAQDTSESPTQKPITLAQDTSKSPTFNPVTLVPTVPLLNASGTNFSLTASSNIPSGLPTGQPTFLSHTPSIMPNAAYPTSEYPSTSPTEDAIFESQSTESKYDNGLFIVYIVAGASVVYCAMFLSYRNCIQKKQDDEPRKIVNRKIDEEWNVSYDSLLGPKHVQSDRKEIPSDYKERQQAFQKMPLKADNRRSVESFDSSTSFLIAVN